MIKDKTPMVNYGSNFSVAPSTTLNIILYPIPDFDAGDAEFLVTDEEEESLFLERIVGSIHLAYAQAANANVGWVLMPMGVDYEALAVLQPYQSPWTPQSTEWDNEKLWDKRFYQVEDGPTAPNVVDHPYWTQVDTRPRMLLGSGRNLWPVLVVRNPHATVTLNGVHYLTAFWK